MVDCLITEIENQYKWDIRFLELAKQISTWSKDPSTKCGAVIVDNNRRVVSIGYNGFAVGVEDEQERYEDRDTKYSIVVHAETNAMLFAQRELTGCTLYTYPGPSCSNCASLVIQSGIRRCVAPMPTKEQAERWRLSLSMEQFREAGVKLDTYTEPLPRL